jgi:hypothetical protein
MANCLSGRHDTPHKTAVWHRTTTGAYATGAKGDGMSTYTLTLILLLLTAGIAAASGLYLVWSVREGDRLFAWGWAGLFVASSLLASLCFRRLGVP